MISLVDREIVSRFLLIFVTTSESQDDTNAKSKAIFIDISIAVFTLNA